MVSAQDRFGLPVDSLLPQLVVSAAVVLLLILVRGVVLRGVHRRIDDPDVWYRTRKVVTYATVGVAAAVLLFVWVPQLRGLGTFLGLVSAGVAIALSDVLKNLAGWLFIVTRRPFRVDDRIEIDDRAGDVIDIRLFRFTLLEIRNWVDADQSTGRLVHVPNGRVLTSPLANFTEGFEYVWHEIPLRLTFESDWKRAEELFLEILRTANPEIGEQAAQRVRHASRHYHIRYTHFTPTVYVSVRENGVLLTGRLLVGARQRRAVEQKVWRALLDAIAAEPTVTIAYPTVRTRIAEPLVVDLPDGRDQRGTPGS